MPTFTVSSSNAKAQDLWLVDGLPDFAMFPGGVLAEVPTSVPIRLHVGTAAYGELHIQKRHGHWVSKLCKSVPEFVHQKLGQPGNIYCTEVENKVKISLRLNPASLLIMNLIANGTQDYFSVTSLYMHPAKLDGMVIGRYQGRRIFVAPQILVK